VAFTNFRNIIWKLDMLMEEHRDLQDLFC
jgi:hypothetical protein